MIFAKVTSRPTRFALFAAVSAFAVASAQPVLAQTPPLPTVPISQAPKGAYDRIEASFEMAGLKTNPFDFKTTDVLVQVMCPDGSSLRVPAFYDGGAVWRVRFTPRAPGTYRIASVTLNGQPASETRLYPRDWVVAGAPQPGFLRIDANNKTRFAFDNGARYFPLGANVAWGEIPVIFPKMGEQGENWARIWMTHWAGNNLDWPQNGKIDLGQLDLGAARKWDTILENAERNGIHIQMVLQHHGQYSTSTNPNWQDNPWNAKNGGFLNTPEEFFTNERARELTKAKYRYIVARYGYSPSIMAWELFNEVQWTDAINHKREATVVAWHNEMADFLRAQDVQNHLVTTSDTTVPAIFENMDYLQHHDYPNDLLGSAATAGTAIAPSLNVKPNFSGEVDTGAAGINSTRAIVFASLMAGESGAAQGWYWDRYEADNSYSAFGSAVRFVKASNWAARDDLARFSPQIVMNERIDLSLRPGAGWAAQQQSEFSIDGSSAPAAFTKFPAYFFGTGSTGMSKGPTTFRVNAPKAGHMTIHIDQLSKKGSHFKVSVDGQLKAEKDFPAANENKQVSIEISVDYPAGPHAITVENSGEDWAHIRDFTFTESVIPLGAYGVTNRQFAAMYIYNRDQVFAPQVTQRFSGKVRIGGLLPGQYRATWWDTALGQPLLSVPVKIGASGQPFDLALPPVSRDIAVYIQKIDEATATSLLPRNSRLKIKPNP